MADIPPNPRVSAASTALPEYTAAARFPLPHPKTDEQFSPAFSPARLETRAYAHRLSNLPCRLPR